ncbi:alpha/beta hydrolase [Shouchella miscanthi]|uniref:Alpha/beta hydrolase n=1 Tax=Shouchella miscanthi TaxID=2598861 RepID=A0ABU6NG29_9BACI|nr:alpha/beta hydrolase [Shouchella miscanthi]
MSKRKPDQASYLHIHEASIYYEWFKSIKPKKGTLLLIHGIFASVTCFYRVIPALREEYDLICCDLPGFGRSSKGNGSVYSFSAYADQLGELMTQLHVDSFHVLGHSMGGQIALYLAYRQPDRVISISLLASSGYLKPVKKPFQVATYFPLIEKSLNWVMHYRKPQVRLFLQDAVYNKRCLSADMIANYEGPLSDPLFINGLIQLTRQREGDLSQAQLHQIHQPVLILSGVEDPLISIETSYALHRDLHNSRIHVIKQCGHLLLEEKPKQVNKRVKNFLLSVHH